MTDPHPHTGPGRHGAPPQRAPARQPRRRSLSRLLAVTAGSLAIAAVAVAVLAGAGVFTHRSMTVHGIEQVVVTSEDGMTAQQAFPDITSGTQVTVVNTAGAVIGTAILGSSDPSSWGPQNAVYSFTVTVPAGLARYGIQIGRNRGTAWLTQAQMRRGPELSVTG